jgi:RNA polymerase sigma-70 factor (ECF subfamily)
VDATTEHAWIDRAQAGDHAAFAALADAYWGRVCRWLRGMTRCPHTAEDLTQDVFLRAWSSLGTFTPGTSFRAWLFRIAANRFIDVRRGPRGKSARILPAALSGRDPGPVAVILADECQARVRSAIERLPAAFRAVFLLRIQEGLPFADIAVALRVTEETVRWRLFKARQRLLQELGDYLDGPS